MQSEELIGSWGGCFANVIHEIPRNGLETAKFALNHDNRRNVVNFSRIENVPWDLPFAGRRRLDKGGEWSFWDTFGCCSEPVGFTF